MLDAVLNLECSFVRVCVELEHNVDVMRIDDWKPRSTKFAGN